MNRKLLLALLLCVFSSGPANAIIIEGEFGGVINEVIDRGVYDDDYTTFWRNVKIGDAVHGTYWYDSELAPSPSEFSDGNQFQYRNFGPDIPVWSGMTATVDRHIFDITQNQPDPDIWKPYIVDRGVSVSNEVNTGFELIDGFAVINTILLKTADSRFSSTVLSFGIGGKDIGIFNSTKLGQEFSWFDEKSDPIYNGGVIGKSGYNDDGQYEAEVRFTATYVTARVKKDVEVSEPGILLLMLIGMASLLARRKSKQTHVLA